MFTVLTYFPFFHLVEKDLLRVKSECCVVKMALLVYKRENCDFDSADPSSMEGSSYELS